ncbi:MAG: hypothetical protein IJW31_00015 [Lentisphaeria bacterium]|nr:hypothetical protein [Lentisphaeria bacterium]
MNIKFLGFILISAIGLLGYQLFSSEDIASQYQSNRIEATPEHHAELVNLSKIIQNNLAKKNYRFLEQCFHMKAADRQIYKYNNQTDPVTESMEVLKNAEGRIVWDQPKSFTFDKSPRKFELELATSNKKEQILVKFYKLKNGYYIESITAKTL